MELKKNTYEVGLVVGIKRERDYWRNKIKEKIEELGEAEKMYALDFNIGRKFLEELLKGE